GIHGARVTGKLTRVFGMGALVNAALLLTLAQWLGIASAAVGFLASTMVAAGLAAWYSNRHYDTGFGLGRLAAVAGLSTAMATSAWLLAAPVDLLAFDWHDFGWRA